MTSLRTFDALISCSCSVRLNATSVVHTCSYHSAGRRLLVPPNHIVGDHHQSNPVAHFGQSRCQRSSANHGDFYPCCSVPKCTFGDGTDNIFRRYSTEFGITRRRGRVQDDLVSANPQVRTGEQAGIETPQKGALKG